MKDNMKIGCDKVGELIVEYIDGELDEATAELIKQHIEGCSDCQKLYRDMAMVCAAAAESAYEAPEELHGRVMDAVSCEKTASKRRARILNMTKTSRWLGVGIAAMLFVCVGIAGSFKILPKLVNTESNDSAPTETYYNASADKAISSSYSMGDIADGMYSENAEAESPQVLIYKTVKATLVLPDEETLVVSGEKDDAIFPAPQEPAGEDKYSSADTPMPSESATVQSPLSLAQIIVGSWEIKTDSETVKIVFSNKNECKYTLYTATEIITGNYSLNDHFLSLEVSEKNSALYIIGIENGVMTLLQVSQDGLF